MFDKSNDRSKYIYYTNYHLVRWLPRIPFVDAASGTPNHRYGSKFSTYNKQTYIYTHTYGREGL